VEIVASIKRTSIHDSRGFGLGVAQSTNKILGAPASGAMFAVGLNSAPSGTNDELGKELTLSLHATLQRAGFI